MASHALILIDNRRQESRVAAPLTGAAQHCTMGGMVEYGGVTSALAVLVSAIVGVLGSVTGLPHTAGQVPASLGAVATQAHLPKSAVRSAYDAAPFRQPALRFLYSAGWATAAAKKSQCAVADLLGEDRVKSIRDSLRRSPQLRARVRAAHLTESQAATAIARGMADGCRS